MPWCRYASRTLSSSLKRRVKFKTTLFSWSWQSCSTAVHQHGSLNVKIKQERQEDLFLLLTRFLSRMLYNIWYLTYVLYMLYIQWQFLYVYSIYFELEAELDKKGYMTVWMNDIVTEWVKDRHIYILLMYVFDNCFFEI